MAFFRRGDIGAVQFRHSAATIGFEPGEDRSAVRGRIAAGKPLPLRLQLVEIDAHPLDGCAQYGAARSVLSEDRQEAPGAMRLAAGLLDLGALTADRVIIFCKQPRLPPGTPGPGKFALHLAADAGGSLCRKGAEKRN